MERVFGYYPQSRMPLTDVFLTQCGWETCVAGHSHGPAVRDHFLIHYVAAGRGTFQKDGQSQLLSAGEGFVIFPSETTTYVADAAAPWTYYWVGFSGTAAASLLDSAGISPQHPVFRLSGPAEDVTDCIKAIHIGASLPGGGELRALGLLLQFLAMILDAVPSPSQNHSPGTPQSEYVGKAIRYVQEHHLGALSIDDMARHIGINRSHLFRVFKATLGIGPQQYILSFRIKRACQLLIETNMPIQEISDYLGFSTPTHMGVAFRRLHGFSPRDYRRAFRASSSGA